MHQIQDLTREAAGRIRYVLMDIDDTITTEGKLPADSYASLWRLHEAGIRVVPITGRPAGWCDLIARQWPVDGVVGENGALVFWEEDGHLKRIYHEQAVPNDHAVLKRIEQRVLAEVEGTRVAGDQFGRMFDLAIDFAEEEPRLPLSDAQRIKEICEQEGAVAKISSIHVNTWMGTYDKLSMASRFLALRFGYDDAKQVAEVIYFGDSPNDEPMFTHFPTSVGVANIADYAHLMRVLPAFTTSLKGGLGFAEGVTVLLEKRREA
ncbi:MAG: HAD family phosphatase [Spirochaetae bacterium HGW-Spirochaetae-4]|nr:MAG: haloacid dehalogenase [Spirochaetes bacterium GWC2_52_13]OHD64941.1 MAG: haloacid dehalogenase [Spirochaetes bacterium GWF2_52_7]PKL21547.1 MAG: HAD family phosphatase [Spirochaetae bacterium HGW-Spirochaetae-4]HCG63423.1 HAD family phosphatase [Sphaerochaeta sp.]